jgi:hypothetical protein
VITEAQKNGKTKLALKIVDQRQTASVLLGTSNEVDGHLEQAAGRHSR